MDRLTNIRGRKVSAQRLCAITLRDFKLRVFLFFEILGEMTKKRLKGRQNKGKCRGNSGKVWEKSE